MTQLTTDVTPSERSLALIAHALSFVEGGVVGPLVLYALRDPIHDALFKDKPGRDSAFVAFHGLQSLYFGLLFAVVSLPVAILTCGWGLLLTVPIYFVFELIACVRANQGEWYHLPLAGEWAARTHPPPFARI